MFVLAMICLRYTRRSVIVVLTLTLFSHSNSVHMLLNWLSVQ